MLFYSKKALSIFVFVASVFLSCSRLGLGVRQSTEEIEPNTPIQLYNAASALKGRSIEDVVVKAELPLEQQPLDTHLIRRLAQSVSPAVVSIFTKTKTPYRLKLIPLPTSGLEFDVRGEALGSAFFIHPSGYLLSNHHVVENATAITARTQDGKEYDLTVVASDPVFDLALLKVTNPDREFSALPMADSDDVLVGDWVIAVGNPLGLGHTVTHGIVSQKGRQIVKIEEGEKGRAVSFLQTDTPINPGSSGGPLITLSGAWVAVNTAVLLDTQGISFCVPSSQVKEFLTNVLDGVGERR